MTCKTLVKVFLIWGLGLFVFALIGVVIGPEIDRAYRLSPESIDFGDVSLKGRFGQRWYRLTQFLVLLGSVLLIVAGIIWVKVRRLDSDNSLDLSGRN